MRYVIRAKHNRDHFLAPSGVPVWGVEEAARFDTLSEVTEWAMQFGAKRPHVQDAGMNFGYEIAPLSEYGRGDPALERVPRPVTTEPANTSCSGREIRPGETVSVGLNGHLVTVVEYLGNRVYRTVENTGAGTIVDYDRNALWTEGESIRGREALR